MTESPGHPYAPKESEGQLKVADERTLAFWRKAKGKQGLRHSSGVVHIGLLKTIIL